MLDGSSTSSERSGSENLKLSPDVSKESERPKEVKAGFFPLTSFLPSASTSSSGWVWPINASGPWNQNVNQKPEKSKRSPSDVRNAHHKHKKKMKRSQSSSTESSTSSSSSSPGSSASTSSSSSSPESSSISSSSVERRNHRHHHRLHHHHRHHSKHHHHHHSKHHHHRHRSEHHRSASSKRDVIQTAKQLQRRLGKSFEVLDKRMSSDEQERLDRKYTRSRYPIPLVGNLPTNDRATSGGAYLRDEAHKEVIEQSRLVQKIISDIAVKARKKGMLGIGEAAGDALDVLYSQQTLVHRERQIDKMGADAVRAISKENEEDWITGGQKKRLRQRAIEQKQLEEVTKKSHVVAGRGEARSSGSSLPGTYNPRKPFGSRGGPRSNRVGQPQQSPSNTTSTAPGTALQAAPPALAFAQQHPKKWKRTE